MNRELMRSVSESLLRTKFLVMAHFVKPMREMERDKTEYPPGFMHVLGWLNSKGGPVSMSDLSGASFVSKPNLTTMVDRLCTEGLVERSADVNDRRIVNVSLSQKGVEFLTKHRENVTAFVESRLAMLSDEELDKLNHALKDLTDIIAIIGERQKN